jgi:hypothetical protein
MPGPRYADTCLYIGYMVKMARQANIIPVLATIPTWNCSDPVKCKRAEDADPSPARYTRIAQLNE